MSTTLRPSGNRHHVKCASIHLLGLLIVINYVTAIDYAAYRKDIIPRGTIRQTPITTRNILEDLNLRNVTSVPTLQDATEHLLQYGALLRAQILDTFGKLVYDHYDDFGMSQIEALYQIYRETLERKYNIFDIVPSVLQDPDTRPTKICAYINKHVHTCLKESSGMCMNIKIHDVPHEDTLAKPALNLTRQIYHLGEMTKYYPNGFSLKNVLHHLRAGLLHFTPSLFCGLLHNIQYDNFDDKVRTAERELITFLGKTSKSWIAHKLEKSSVDGKTVSELLKNYLAKGKKLFEERIANQADYLSRHVVREVDAVSENIELLGTIYDNSTINLKYLFELVLPNDIVDRDIREARNYLVHQIRMKNIIERYLSIEKYQQIAPDQLLMEILGQLRDIHFAKDIATSLYTHARFWHKSHMIKNINELLDLFDAYENLRGVKPYRGLMTIIDRTKKNLYNCKNVTVELSCSRPRNCLRIGLHLILNCPMINNETKNLIKLFIGRTTHHCPGLIEDSSKKRKIVKILEPTAELNLVTTIPNSILDHGNYMASKVNSTNHEITEDSEKESHTDQKIDEGSESVFTQEVAESPIDESIMNNECTGNNCTDTNCKGDDCKNSGSLELCAGKQCPEIEVEISDSHEISNENCSDCGTNVTEINCTSPNCLKKIEESAQNHKENLTKTHCEGSDCSESSCETGSCDTENSESEECKGPDCFSGSCEDCEENSIQVDESSNLVSGLSTEVNELVKASPVNCTGPDCSNESELKCEDNNCPKINCTGDDCLVGETVHECEGPDCSNSIEVKCEGSECSEHSNEAEGNDCHGSGCLESNENTKEESCEGSGCSLEETGSIEDCEGEDCQKTEISEDCEGSNCSNADHNIVTSCEDGDCSKSTVEKNCEGPDCSSHEDIIVEECKDCSEESVEEKSCEGSDCSHHEEKMVEHPSEISSETCTGKDCFCTGKNCTKTSSSESEEKEHSEESAEDLSEASTVGQITKSSILTPLCNNSDPQYQRKLHRLRKIRLIDALSSKPRSSHEIINKLVTSSVDKKHKINDETSWKMKIDEKARLKMNDAKSTSLKMDNLKKTSLKMKHLGDELEDNGDMSHATVSTRRRLNQRIISHHPIHSYEFETSFKKSRGGKNDMHDRNNIRDNLLIAKYGKELGKAISIMTKKKVKKELDKMNAKNSEGLVTTMNLLSGVGKNEKHQDSSYETITPVRRYIESHSKVHRNRTHNYRWVPKHSKSRVSSNNEKNKIRTMVIERSPKVKTSVYKRIHRTRKTNEKRARKEKKVYHQYVIRETPGN